MIGRWLDRLASVVSPAWALRRSLARRAYERYSKRGYEAARKDRTNSNWSTANRSADLELQNDASIIRGRVRDLVRNNAYARGVILALVRNVVGTGIVPQAEMMSEDRNRRIEDEFHRWQKTCDAGGRLSFYEMQRLILSEVHEAGEVLVHFVERNEPWRRVPLALELIEADRLADDTTFPLRRSPATGNEVRRGVEITPDGRPVAYWIYPRHPNDLNTYSTTAMRVPAEEILHLYRHERVGQTRGISSMAPVVNWLKTLHYYVENELQASAVASCFTVAVKTLGGGSDGGLMDDAGDSTDSDGNTLEYLQPGMVARLSPGESVETINPGRPNAQASPWIDLMLRSIGVGVGQSYERLTRDYSKTNYSSNRASDLEDRRALRIEQDWLITHLCEPVWQRFIVEASRAGVQGMPEAIDLVDDFESATSHSWQPPGWEWVDPQKEAKAVEIGLQSHTTTLRDEWAKKGVHWRDALAQRAIEQQAIEALGLTSPEEEETDDAETEIEPATA